MKRELAPGLADPGAARRSFDRASASFESADFIHSEARRRLLQRLQLARIAPRVVVDLGAATCKGAESLARRFAEARILAVDTSLPMLNRGRARWESRKQVFPLAADAQRLPLPSASIDLMFANLLLPWCSTEHVLSEAARVLADGGRLMFSTFGPDTLREVREAWRGLDDRLHVHGFFDMHDVGDLVVRAGLSEPVMDVDRLNVTYAGLHSLIEDLRACGAVNVAVGRRSTLTGPKRWQGFVNALESQQRGDRISVTVELVFGEAWGTGGSGREGSADGEVRFPVDRLTRVSRER